MTIGLEKIIPAERVAFLESRDKDSALREMVRLVARSSEVADESRLLDAVLERERIMSTGIGLGIAVPHAKIGSVRDFVVGFGKAQEGIDFQSLDGRPVRFIVLIAGPEDQQERYLQLLARITLKLKDPGTRRELADAPDVPGILEALR